jgi:Sec-independent protein translocase protein TatA
MFGALLQPAHLLIIVAILVLFFGGRVFADLGKGFAGAVRNFKSSVRSSRRIDGPD